MGGDEHDERRDAGEHEISAAIERRVELAHVGEAPDQHEQAREAEDVQGQRRTPPERSSQLPRWQQHRHTGADEEPTRMRVGAVVDA
jgi:hypothetical protein